MRRLKRRLAHGWIVAILLGLFLPAPLAAQQMLAADIEALQSDALAGDAVAQLTLAEAYNSGDGLIQNYREARRWYEAAAQQGLARATLMLGRYERSGLTGPADGAKAVSLFEAAAQQGNVDALVELGLLYETGVLAPSDGEKARDYYRTASELGSLEATTNLATLLYEGKLVPQDLETARSLFLRAAREGNPRAQNNLGLLFVRGDGVAQDYEAAALWFELAAQQGERSAMTNLGTLYDNGFGVPQSDEEAKRWYRRAADTARGIVTALEGDSFDPWVAGSILSPTDMAFAQRRADLGDPIARYRLGLTALASEPPNHFAAAQHFQRAADAGYGPAMINLGMLYQQGNGVIEDFTAAYALFSRAGAAGFSDALVLRDTLAANMSPRQILEAQALAATE